MDPTDRALVDRVLEAYRAGCFPMADGRDAAELGSPVGWYRPLTRGVLPIDPTLSGVPGGVRVPRRLARTVRQRRFVVTSDAAFERVVSACAGPRAASGSCSEETWIDRRIESLFGLLHHAGVAHSIEAWLPGAGGHLELVGGVYGLSVGAVFCAESMYCRPELGGTDASKVALVHLMRHTARRGFRLIDTQMVNPHLEQFGVAEIPAETYQRVLDELGHQEVAWLPFDPDADSAA
ncbi:MAG: leucyl/phenylalanyl-tRNA--protein transferase [Phycisphaerales bacterium]